VVSVDTVKQVLYQHRKDLLLLPNVVGVGIGKKLTRGVESDELVVVVFVERNCRQTIFCAGLSSPKPSAR
jgi:hypothetical protein